MTRVYIVLPPESESPPPIALPGFVTDVRPPATGPALALAKAADLAGLAGVVVPADPDGPEPLVTAGALLRATRHVEVLAAVEPWIATPQYTAKFSASLQRFSGGRFGWYVDAADQEAEAFVGTARDFWKRPEGLPDVLSEHAFPRVITTAAPRLDVRGLAPAEIVALVEKQAADEVLLEVGVEPGEVLRLGEYVLPQLRTLTIDGEEAGRVR